MRVGRSIYAALRPPIALWRPPHVRGKREEKGAEVEREGNGGPSRQHEART